MPPLAAPLVLPKETGPRLVDQLPLLGLAARRRLDPEIGERRPAWLALLPLLATAAALTSCGPGTCVNGWCWETPTPQGHELDAVLALSRNDVWAAGASGTLLHFDGTQWTHFASPTRDRIEALAAVGPNDIWAGGWGMQPLHWDGTAWTDSHQQAGLKAFSGTGADNFWAVGWQQLYTLESGRWVAAKGLPEGMGASGEAVWTSGPRDVWATGNRGLLHFDGTAWTAVEPRAAPSEYGGLWGRAPDDVWALAETAVLHFDGAGWTELPIPISGRLGHLWGTGEGPPWLVGYGRVARWDGTAYVEVPELEGALGLGGTGAADLWAVGDRGMMSHFDGQRWGARSARLDVQDLNDVASSAPDDVWAVGRAGRFVHFDGRAWTAATTGREDDLMGVFAFSATDVWMVGGDWTSTATNVALHFDGSSWTAYEGIGKGRLLRVWGAAPDDVWAAGDYSLVHWDGTAWTQDPIRPGNLRGLTGTARDDVWAVGSGGVFHFDGAQWSRPEAAPPSAQAVWARTRSDVWLVQGASTWHFDGSAWTEHVLDPGRSGWSGGAAAIVGARPDDVWAVAGGDAWWWDGGSWRRVDMPTFPTAFTARGETLYGVSGDGLIRRR